MTDYEARLFLAIVIVFVLYQMTRMYYRLYYNCEAIERFASQLFVENFDLRSRLAKEVKSDTPKNEYTAS